MRCEVTASARRLLAEVSPSGGWARQRGWAAYLCHSTPQSETSVTAARHADRKRPHGRADNAYI